MNIAVIGAHIDDPECGCGGLAAIAAGQGHNVWFGYLASGVTGSQIHEMDESEFREKEAEAACGVCGVKPHFFRFPGTDVPVNKSAIAKVSQFLKDIDADIVVAHWPVDTHPDHQAAGVLATQAVVGNPDVALAYFQVLPGVQTLAFTPNAFVDITAVVQVKERAVRCCASQNVDDWWRYQDDVEKHYHALSNGFSETENGRAEGYHVMVSTPTTAQLFGGGRTFLHPSGGRAVRKMKHDCTEI